MKNFLLITFLTFTALCQAQNNKPLIKTVVTEKRIIVTSGKISYEEFDTLINETVKQYEDRRGIQIIVKAPGHKTFNHKLPDAAKPEAIAFRIISLDKKLSNGSSDELQQKPIKFSTEKDIIRIETQDSLRPKP